MRRWTTLGQKMFNRGRERRGLCDRKVGQARERVEKRVSEVGRKRGGA